VLHPRRATARLGRCAAALETLRRVYREHEPDVAIILGKEPERDLIDRVALDRDLHGRQHPEWARATSVYAPDRAVTIGTS